jgi:hypothetical protein
MRISSQAKDLPVLCTVAALFSHSVSAGTVQLPGLKLPENSQVDRVNVVQIFKDSYDPYVKIAFPHDDLAPVSKGWIGQRPLLFPAILRLTLPRVGKQMGETDGGPR